MRNTTFRDRLLDDDRTLHAERGMEGVGAAQRVGAGGGDEGDVNAAMAVDVDRSTAELGRVRGAHRGGAEESGGAEIVAAGAGVFEVEDDRLAGAQVQRCGRELEARQRDGDARGVAPVRLGGGRRGEGEGSETGEEKGPLHGSYPPWRDGADPIPVWRSAPEPRPRRPRPARERPAASGGGRPGSAIRGGSARGDRRCALRRARRGAPAPPGPIPAGIAG